MKFQVSGTIYLDSEIIVTSPYLTIDGSSAPGNGITLIGAGAYRGITINTHDVIVSNLRFRNYPGEGIEVYGDYNIIIDHCSVTGQATEVWILTAGRTILPSDGVCSAAALKCIAATANRRRCTTICITRTIVVSRRFSRLVLNTISATT